MVVLPAELNCKRTKILDLFYLFELIFLNYVLYYSILLFICQVKRFLSFYVITEGVMKIDHRKTDKLRHNTQKKILCSCFGSN